MLHRSLCKTLLLQHLGVRMRHGVVEWHFGSGSKRIAERPIHIDTQKHSSAMWYVVWKLPVLHLGHYRYTQHWNEFSDKEVSYHVGCCSLPTVFRRQIARLVRYYLINTLHHNCAYKCIWTSKDFSDNLPIHNSSFFFVCFCLLSYYILFPFPSLFNLLCVIAPGSFHVLLFSLPTLSAGFSSLFKQQLLGFHYRRQCQ